MPETYVTMGSQVFKFDLPDGPMPKLQFPTINEIVERHKEKTKEQPVAPNLNAVLAEQGNAERMGVTYDGDTTAENMERMGIPYDGDPAEGNWGDSQEMFPDANAPTLNVPTPNAHGVTAYSAPNLNQMIQNEYAAKQRPARAPNYAGAGGGAPRGTHVEQPYIAPTF